MDQLNFSSQDLRLLSELKTLFEFVSPGNLRRTQLDLFFHALVTSEGELPNQEELVLNFSYLVNFFNAAEDIRRDD